MTPFRKTRPGAPPAYFEIEAAGLHWLRVPDGPPVASVLAVGPHHLDLQRIAPGHGGPDTYRRFGGQLAHLHSLRAPSFGCPPAGVTRDAGFIADLPLPYGSWESFGPFYAQARLLPYIDALRARGDLPRPASEVLLRLLGELQNGHPRIVGPATTPSRIHGDLWSGNVLWGRPGDSTDGEINGWLIDAAAHGGHAETDLAMLALFGQPGLEHIITGYQAVRPLQPQWRDRIALHQVHPLLVHAVLFGGSYLRQAVAAAQSALKVA